jgi:FKBP-type peptidyl-prolyl cis-trans isomerase
MGNTKILVFAGIAVAVVGLIIAITGMLIMNNHQKKTVANADANKTLGASTDTATNQEPQSQASSANGLTSDQATSIGGQGQSQQADPAALLDPTTFAKYDQYKDKTQALFVNLQDGSGDELTAGKTAVVLYKGWLTNGQLFDASRPDQSGKLQPFTFTLGQHQVIAGWEQGMAGMKAGGVRLLVIPPSVGYGADGQGPIPPNSVLVFQVQLVAVQ